MSADIKQLREVVNGAAADLKRLSDVALAADTRGEDFTPEDRAARLAAARCLVATLNRLEPRDLDAISEFGDIRARAHDVIALAERGPELCRLTQRPLHALTDYGNAERIADAHDEWLRFAPGLGWLVWDGTRWRRDDDGAAMRLAKETVRAIRSEARELDNDDEAEKTFKHAVRSESAPRLRAGLELAQSEAALLINTDDLDADPFVLNAANGTVNLRTGELREHDPDDLLTMLASVEYDPDAEAPTWADFLERTLPDPTLRGWAQKLAGYTLTGDTSEQALVLVHARRPHRAGRQ